MKAKSTPKIVKTSSKNIQSAKLKLPVAGRPLVKYPINADVLDGIFWIDNSGRLHVATATYGWKLLKGKSGALKRATS